jgi:hypothetical protein
MIDNFQCPWPGPRPYDISDGYYFLGRENEILEINRQIFRSQLTILSAESGAGKTSLLRAGLIYRILQERSEDQTIKPVLLLNKWVGSTNSPLEQIFEDALVTAINSYDQISKIDEKITNSSFLKAQAEKEYQLLHSVRAGQNFLEHLVNLSDDPRMGGVILIMDQFEEIIRSGRKNCDRALSLISKIYQQEPRVTLVISLRQEFEPKLRSLESQIGGLFKRTMHLDPMVTKTARKVITEMPKIITNLEITPPVDDYLLDLISKDEKVVNIENESVQFGAEEDPVNLLRLQAILREVYEYAYHQNKDKNEVTIDLKTVTNFENQFEKGELVNQSLTRWIEKALNTESSDWVDRISELQTGKLIFPKHIKQLFELPQEITSGLVQRLAASLSRYMSSGGLKTSVEQYGLLFNALERDLRRLFKDFEQQDWEITVVPYPSAERTNKENADTEDILYNLSGSAYLKGWTNTQTFENLIAIFFETILRLEEQNIIKEIQTHNGLFFELTHDGLGEPFNTWAKKQMDTWEECVSSLTINRGVDFVINNEVREGFCTVERNRWKGCYIKPYYVGKVLRNIKFISSELIGCVFEECNFQGVQFFDCDLDGTIFINCRFEPNPETNEPTLFDTCRATGLTFSSPEGQHSVFNNVIFKKCSFKQFNLQDIVLEGDIILDQGTNLVQAQFIKITAAENCLMSKIKMNDETGTLQYCIWDEQSAWVLDIQKYMVSLTGNAKVTTSGPLFNVK